MRVNMICIYPKDAIFTVSLLNLTGISAAVLSMCVEFQSDLKILDSNLVASRLHEILP